VPLADLSALRAALTDPDAYDWIVFTSQNTVHVVCDRLVEWGLAARDLARMAVAAIGPATAQALERYGVTPDVVPPKYVAEAVVASGRFSAAVIGPVTAASARELGLPVAIEAEDYTVGGLVAALVRYYAEGGTGKGET